MCAQSAGVRVMLRQSWVWGKAGGWHADQATVTTQTQWKAHAEDRDNNTQVVIPNWEYCLNQTFWKKKKRKENTFYWFYNNEILKNRL